MRRGGRGGTISEQAECKGSSEYGGPVMTLLSRVFFGDVHGAGVAATNDDDAGECPRNWRCAFNDGIHSHQRTGLW